MPPEKNSSETETWECPIKIKALLTEPILLNLDNSELFLEQKSNDLATGYYRISFLSDSINESKAKAIVKRDCNFFSQILAFNEIHRMEPDINQIKRISKSNLKIYTHSVGVEAEINLEPRACVNEDLKFMSKVIEKINNSNYKENLIMSINWVTKEAINNIEAFLYNWISFNILFSLLSPTKSNKKGIEFFSQKYPNLEIVNERLNQNNKLIIELSDMDIVSDYDEKYSLLLKDALSLSDKRQIWKYLLLCIYQIRNELFHKGKQSDFPLDRINLLMTEVIKITILDIINLKFVQSKTPRKFTVGFGMTLNDP